MKRPRQAVGKAWSDEVRGWLVGADKVLREAPAYVERATKAASMFHTTKGPNGSMLGPLKHFVDRISQGTYPDPEHAMYLASCIKRYLDCEVSSLEKAFDIGGRRRSGDARDERQARTNKIIWYGTMRSLIVEEGLTQLKAAQRVKVQFGLRAGDKSLVRGYRAWLRKMENGLLEFLRATKAD